jgi:hypothetical protein
MQSLKNTDLDNQLDFDDEILIFVSVFIKISHNNTPALLIALSDLSEIHKLEYELFKVEQDEETFTFVLRSESPEVYFLGHSLKYSLEVGGFLL